MASPPSLRFKASAGGLSLLRSARRRRAWLAVKLCFTASEREDGGFEDAAVDAPVCAPVDDDGAVGFEAGVEEGEVEGGPVGGVVGEVGAVLAGTAAAVGRLSLEVLDGRVRPSGDGRRWRRRGGGEGEGGESAGSRVVNQMRRSLGIGPSPSRSASATTPPTSIQARGGRSRR